MTTSSAQVMKILSSSAKTRKVELSHARTRSSCVELRVVMHEYLFSVSRIYFSLVSKIGIGKLRVLVVFHAGACILVKVLDLCLQ